MSDGMQFPVYLKVNSDLEAISVFERAMEGATQRSKRAFERNMAEIGSVIEKGLGRGVTAAGSLDLNVGQFRQAAAEARVYGEALNATIRAAQALAIETKDTSEATRLYIQSLSAQRIEAERAEAAANAQVSTYTKLQAALDATGSRVSRLSQAYRGLYAEQAKIAQEEVRQRSALGRLMDQGIDFQKNKFAGSAERSASAFANQGYASNVDQRSGVERLISGGASIDRAALSAANLDAVLGRVANKADGVAAATQRMAAATEQAAAEQARAALEAEAAEKRAAAAKAEYATQAERLRAQLDPMFAAQQRFNSALDQADTLLKNGAITEREYQAANALARQELQQHAQAVAGMATAERSLQVAHKQGTTANQAVINSVRSQRQAYLQLGQQLQDVAIQAQMGTNPFVILTQQGSQAAFALSGLKGKAGEVARFLAGPWGAALFIGVTALGGLVKGIRDSSNAAKEAEKAHQTLADKLDLERNAYDDVIRAAREYNKEQENSRQLTLDAAQAVALKAKADINAAIAIRQKLSAQLAEANRMATDQASNLNVRGAAGITSVGIADRIAENDNELRALTATARNSVISIADEMAKISSDPRYAIEQRFERLRNEAKASIKDVAALSARLASLNTQKQTALDGLKANSGSGENSVNTMTALVKQLFPGARITSTTGGRHAKGSDHYAGRAIDFVPTEGMGMYSTAEVEKILQDAGVNIRYGKGGKKQIFGPGDKGHNDHFHFAWSGGAPSPDRVAAAAERRRNASQEFASDSADKIARITEQFNYAPNAVARTNQAIRTLNDLISDLQTKKPPNFETLIKQATEAKGIVESNLTKPLDDYMKRAREMAAVDDLRAKGRDDEVAALQDVLRLQEQMGPLTEQQMNDVMATVVAERQRAAVIRDTQAALQEYVQSVQNVRQALEDTVNNALRGRLNVSNIFKSIGNAYLDLKSKQIVEGLFGGALRDLEDQIYGGNKVKEASEAISGSLYYGQNAVEGFADTVMRVSDLINGIDLASVGLKDPGSLVNSDGSPRFGSEGEIIVNGGRSGSPASIQRMMTPERFVTGALDKMFGAMGIRLPKIFGDSLGRAVQGAAYGQIGGGLLTAIGGRSSGTGASIGGVFGEAAFKKLAPKLFSKLGDFAGPLGSIAGGLIGGLVGGLFGKTPKGVATIGGSGSSLKVASLTGNSSQMKQAAGSSADAAITTLEGLAEQLGGAVNASRGSVSIGVRKGKYYVDPTGRGAVKEKKGAISFGEDAAAAVKAATMDLIKDGVIEGLRASTLRLLQQGKDLEAAAAKAVKFESVFQRLKAYTDPVGAAIDTVDKEFRSLKKIFEEAGASAAEYADLETLYQKERAKAVEEASAQMTSALRGLLDELQTGDNGRSLRDRLSAALVAYDPMAADLRAGKQVDYEKFAEAARTVLDIQRQLDGSQGGYFARLDEITNLTAKALADQQNVISIATGRPSTISSSVEPTYEPVVSAIQGMASQLTSLGLATNQNLGALLAAFQGVGGVNPTTALPLRLF